MKQLGILASMLISMHCFAVVNIVTTTTDLAWAAKQIGGKLVEVTSLLRGSENPHYVDAVPEFIRLAANAQMVCSVGLELEVGWLPKVLARSGNAQVQPGGKGYCETGRGITVLDKLEGRVDRSMGDVHPAGNPHYWISPSTFAQGAKIIAQTLYAVDPVNMAIYHKNYHELAKKLIAIEDANKAKLAPYKTLLSKAIMMEYHQEFSYFLSTYGLKSHGSIEEKPGVAPSAGRLAEVSIAAKASGIFFALAADTAPRSTLNRFTEMSGVAIVMVPMSLYPADGLSDYFVFQNLIVDKIVAQLEKLKVSTTKGV